jgi:hypothetical protein
MPFPQYDLLAQKCFFHNLVIGYAKEYSQATHVLASFSFTPTFSNTTLTLTTLHFKLNGYFPFFLQNYELDQDFKFSFDSFKLTFYNVSHLLTSGPFGMVFEHLQDYFHPRI